MAVHASHNGLIAGNVVVGGDQLTGAGIAVEDGSESNNLFSHNFVALIRGDVNPRESGTDTQTPGSGGECFWAAGFDNRFVDNVASTCRNSFQQVVSGAGFKFFAPSLAFTAKKPKERGGDVEVEEEAEIVTPQFTPLRQFERNEVYGATASAFTIWHLGTDGFDCPGCPGDGKPTIGESVVKDLHVWNTYESAVWLYPTNHLTIDGLVHRINPPATDFDNDLDISEPSVQGSDYRLMNVTIRNSDIHAGAVFGNASGSVQNIHIENVQATTFYAAFGFDAPNTPGTFAEINDPPGVSALLKNNVVTPWPGYPLRAISTWTPFPLDPPDIIDFDALPWGYQPDVSVKIRVEDYQGIPGRNFRVYFEEQLDRSDLFGGQAECTDTTTYPEIDGIVCSTAPDPDTDFDDDGLSDDVDLDDDNDGQTDLEELACGSDPLDAASQSADDDHDGIPNCVDTPDTSDFDNDGIFDNLDPDDDNDGQTDVDEIQCGSNPLDNTSLSLDTDSDHQPNCVDADDDGDGINDDHDAFPLDVNESVDTDGDGTGNNADTDDDNDGAADGNDAFPLDKNESVDTDGDGTGNNADTDDDNDGVADGNDAFPLDKNESVDTDGDGTGNNADTDDDNDGVADGNDAFPLDKNESVDTDGDGTGNNADTDDDNDGVADGTDAFPLDKNESVDTDGDGTGNNADTDDDNDGVADGNDAFPLDKNESVDTDGDGTGNNADTDDDNDGVADGTDAFPLDKNESVDTDGDGTGNNADTDDDNDGVADGTDAFPLDKNESVDTDGDGTGNNADTDDDNDGQTDADEIACGSNPLVKTSVSLDTDNDRRPNCVDTDDDGDGVADATDNCPLTANADQDDSDNDGTGDACDTPASELRLENPGPQTDTEGDRVALLMKSNVLELVLKALKKHKPVKAVSFSATNLPPNLHIDKKLGLISGQVGRTSVGVYPVTVTLRYGDDEVSVAFQWTIKAKNRPPVVKSPGNQKNRRNQVVSLQIEASDPEGDPLTFHAHDLPEGLSINPTTGLITGTIECKEAGPHHVEIRVSDGEDRTTIRFEWMILENGRPTVTPPGTQINRVGDTVSLQIVAIDPDGDELEFSANLLPDGLKIDRRTGLITGTIKKKAATVGTHQVEILASDGRLRHAIFFTWKVKP